MRTGDTTYDAKKPQTAPSTCHATTIKKTDNNTPQSIAVAPGGEPPPTPQYPRYYLMNQSN